MTAAIRWCLLWRFLFSLANASWEVEQNLCSRYTQVGLRFDRLGGGSCITKEEGGHSLPNSGTRQKHQDGQHCGQDQGLLQANERHGLLRVSCFVEGDKDDCGGRGQKGCGSLGRGGQAFCDLRLEAGLEVVEKVKPSRDGSDLLGLRHADLLQVHGLGAQCCGLSFSWHGTWRGGGDCAGSQGQGSADNHTSLDLQQVAVSTASTFGSTRANVCGWIMDETGEEDLVAFVRTTTDGSDSSQAEPQQLPPAQSSNEIPMGLSVQRMTHEGYGFPVMLPQRTMVMNIDGACMQCGTQLDGHTLRVGAYGAHLAIYYPLGQCPACRMRLCRECGPVVQGNIRRDDPDGVNAGHWHCASCTPTSGTLAPTMPGPDGDQPPTTGLATTMCHACGLHQCSTCAYWHQCVPQPTAATTTGDPNANRAGRRQLGDYARGGIRQAGSSSGDNYRNTSSASRSATASFWSRPGPLIILMAAATRTRFSLWVVALVAFSQLQVGVGPKRLEPMGTTPSLKRGPQAWEEYAANPLVPLHQGSTARFLAHSVADATASQWFPKVRPFIYKAENFGRPMGSTEELDMTHDTDDEPNADHESSHSRHG